MPVINLPRDDRFGDLGKGLGGVIGAVAQNAQQQQVQAGVTQIMSDPNISEQDKPVQILKDHGDAGYQMYKNLLTSKAVQAGIKDKLSEVGLRTVQTAAAQAKLDKEFPEQVAHIQAQNKLLGAETKEKTDLLPGKVAQQTAQTGLTTAQGVNVASETDERNALLGGKIGLQPAVKAKTEAETEHLGVQSGLEAASLPSVIAKGEVAKLQLQQLKGTLDDSGASTSLDKILTDSGIKPDSSLGNMAKSAYKMEPDINKKGDAFIKVISGQAQAEGRAAIPAAASEPVQKITGNAVESATSMKTFLDAFVSGGAERMGNVGDILDGKLPASAIVWLEKHGFSSKDEQLVSMWTASTQNSATAATSGGGFYSPGRYGLAKEITPGIGETPLHAIKIADDVADRQIALLENRKASMAPKESKAGVDDALTRWKSIKAVTGTFKRDNIQPWTVTINKPDGKTETVEMNGINGQQPPVAGTAMNGGTVANVTAKPGQVVDYFMGSQVDGKTFKKIVDAEKTYEFKGANMKGSILIDEARKRNVAPDVFRDQLKKYYESAR